jgi:hypothetical protein
MSHLDVKQLHLLLPNLLKRAKSIHEIHIRNCEMPLEARRRVDTYVTSLEQLHGKKASLLDFTALAPQYNESDTALHHPQPLKTDTLAPPTKLRKLRDLLIIGPRKDAGMSGSLPSLTSSGASVSYDFVEVAVVNMIRLVKLAGATLSVIKIEDSKLYLNRVYFFEALSRYCPNVK